MQNNLTPRYIIIGIILLWAFITIKPTIEYQYLKDSDKESMKESGDLLELESKIIKQGLDLKGGMYIVLEADIPTLILNLATNTDENILEVHKNSILISEAENLNFFTVFKDQLKKNKIKTERYFTEFGSNTDEIITALIKESEDSIDRVLEILRNRIDQFGVSEPTIQKQGTDRILVELAGIQNSDRARALLQSTALLEFYLVKNPAVTNEMLLQLDDILKSSLNKEEITNLVNTPIKDKKTTIESPNEGAIEVNDIFSDVGNDERPDSIRSNLAYSSPLSSMLDFSTGEMSIREKNLYSFQNLVNKLEVQSKLKSMSGQILIGNKPIIKKGSSNEENFFNIYYLQSNPELTGGVVEEAKASLGSVGSGNSGQPLVSLEMNNDGSKIWSRVTGANIGERIAIVLDKKVHMAPSIREKIPGGRTQIEGFSGINEARDIAIILKAGALPTPIKIIEERIVGPSLGADSIEKGKRSVMIGLISVLIFMLIYYKMAGAIANFALIWNIVLVMAVLATLEATLTLPGIAGLILTVGMSIDSNVIIFERIREELRNGKTPKSAIEGGYKHAITAIIDANVTTVIAALVLNQFGTGPIKGFATVLLWGVLISMFTAIFVTRTILNTNIFIKNNSKMSI